MENFWPNHCPASVPAERVPPQYPPHLALRNRCLFKCRELWGPA